MALTEQELAQLENRPKVLPLYGNGIAVSYKEVFSVNYNMSFTGNDQPHNNIPPTLSIRYWRLVARSLT